MYEDDNGILHNGADVIRDTHNALHYGTPLSQERLLVEPGLENLYPVTTIGEHIDDDETIDALLVSCNL